MPEDDGAADHLAGMALPPLRLPVAGGGQLRPARGRGDRDAGGVRLPAHGHARPAAGAGLGRHPGRARLHAAELRLPRPALRAGRPGRDGRRGSARWTRPSRHAFAEREQLPYPLLNDGPLQLRDELGLPTFDVHGTTLYKRLTFVARAGRIEKVFYPVFPPDRNAAEVESWLCASTT